MTQRTLLTSITLFAFLFALAGAFVFRQATAAADPAKPAHGVGIAQQNRVCITDSFEPNESVTQAKPVGSGLQTPLYICQGDDDFFSIGLGQGETLSVDLFFTHTSGDLELQILNDVGNVLAFATSSSDNESLTYRASTSGTYFIRVFGAGASIENSYEMQVGLSCLDCISYQGQLQNSGSNASGDYEFVFTLYDQAVDGQQVGDAFTQVLSVVDGLFSAELYFGEPNTWSSDYPLFLDILVRPAGTASGFTQLTPRTELTAAPIAFTLVNGATISGTESSLTLNSSLGTGLFISAASDGVRVIQAGDDGIEINGTGDNGIDIRNVGDDGIYINNVTETGVWVDSAGKAAIVGENTSDSFAAGQFLNTTQSIANGSNAGGIGIYARGKSGTSATNPDASDIVLGATSNSSANRTADDGRIASDPAFSSSDLMLASQDKVLVVLDEDINSTGAFFGIYNHGSETADRVFYVNDNGDVRYDGTIAQFRSSGGRGEDSVSYPASGTQPRVQHAGTASLVDGVGTVVIDPAFLQIANTAHPYQVLLTPRGDCALYLAETTETDFTVRALGGATCSVAFDYQIVADDVVSAENRGADGAIDEADLPVAADRSAEEVTP